MTDLELEMVNWFKAELRSYYRDKARVKHLESKLKQLDSRFDAHSPNLTETAVAGRSRDERLAEYAEKRDKIERELKAITMKRVMVEEILTKIDPEYVTPLRQVYSGRQNIAYFAYQAHYTVRAYKGHINKAILAALKKG